MCGSNVENKIAVVRYTDGRYHQLYPWFGDKVV